MKKLIITVFVICLLNSCANVADKSTALKDKIKTSVGNMKDSINHPFKKKK
jgi:hypothetical protein|tara:strand:- start:475 stop:627 length:153 start_codon:yes stop_codon:yes gene_type:complete